METSEFLQQALTFCEKTNTSFTCKYLRTGLHFLGDTENRDIYEITISRGPRKYTTEYGQSIFHSGRYTVTKGRQTYRFNTRSEAIGFCRKKNIAASWVTTNPDFRTADVYSFLSALQKNEVGEFKDFCSEFGYDDLPLSEYPRILKIYEDVKAQYNALIAMYNDDELQALQEIQ